MKLELNSIVETFFLLADADWGKKQKKEAIKKLNAFGINGAVCYAEHFHLIERYYAAFTTHMVRDEGGSYVADMSDQMALTLASLLVAHPAWLDEFESLADEEVLAEVRSGIPALMGLGPDIIDALERSGLSDQARWQLSALWQQPKSRIALVIRAIKANIPAFEQARRAVEAEMAPLLAQLGEVLRTGGLSPMLDQMTALCPHANVVPSLAAPLLVMAVDNTCVLGLLLNRIFVGRTDGLTDAEAVRVAKAMSDENRISILRMLKHDRLYSVELSRKVGLTPATTSYHMNILVSAGLVELAKQNGKVFYQLSAEGIELYRAWLDAQLLQE